MNNDRRRRSTRPTPKRKLGTMDKVLIVVAVLLILFTLEMIHVFKTQGAIPDTLCNCVFLALGGECGVMGWIKTTKDKYKDREWAKEDQAEMRRDNTTE